MATLLSFPIEIKHICNQHYIARFTGLAAEWLFSYITDLLAFSGNQTIHVAILSVCCGLLVEAVLTYTAVVASVRNAL